tara:strand:- start:363 stop:1661 length:1299 start_codon:yes stop_codon:yes gene_type:complete
MYLSIPVLFNYKSIENIIESKFYSDFNINLNINGDIKYQLLPKPHLLISNSLLSINQNNNNHMTVDINNLKVFLNSNSLYPKSKIDFQKIEIQKTNFLLNKKEYSLLRNYLHNSESKPIHIKKSKVFVVDKNDEAFIISPIEKISFTTSKKDNLKKLYIKGNIFDLDFKSLWKKKFNSQMNSQIDIDFKQPNIFIKNKLNYESKSNLKGSASLNYLNQNIEIDYKLQNNLVTLKSPENNNDIKIDTFIEVKPFYLNSNIILNRQNLNFLIDELVFSILNLKSDLLGNLNGNLKLSLTNVEHELLRSGKINFIINQKVIKLSKVLFNLSKIGQIESKIKYQEEGGDLIFHSSNILFIENKNEFAKKFQLKSNIAEKLDRIYFKIEKNINTGSISIFDVKISQLNQQDEKQVKKRYSIRNSQELKSLVKQIING